MTFKPATWYPIAVVLSIANVVGAWFAARTGGPMHAGVHTALAVAFGLWAGRLRQGSGERDLQSGLEALELEMNTLREEVRELQERVDFAERMLAQVPEARRVDPLH